MPASAPLVKASSAIPFESTTASPLPNFAVTIAWTKAQADRVALRFSAHCRGEDCCSWASPVERAKLLDLSSNAAIDLNGDAITGPRSCANGKVELSYSVLVADLSGTTLAESRDGILLSDAAWLAFPKAWQGQAVPTTVVLRDESVDVTKEDSAWSAMPTLAVKSCAKDQSLAQLRTATSLGLGACVQTTLTLLRVIDLALGVQQKHIFYGENGRKDTLLSLGPLPFDPRWIGAELAALRQEIDDLVAPDLGGSWTNFVIPVLHDELGKLGESRTGFAGLQLRVAPSRPWAGTQRLAAGRELSRRWLGGVVPVFGSVSVAAEADAAYDFPSFVAGLAQSLGSEAAQRLNLLDKFDLAENLNAIEAVLATHRHLPLRSPKERQAYGFAWGIVASAMLENFRRTEHNPKRSVLANFIAEILVMRSLDDRSPMGRSEFLEAARAILGEDAQAMFVRVFAGEERLLREWQIRDECLVSKRRNYTYESWGFDARDPGDRVVAQDYTSLPAELRDGDILQQAISVWEAEDATQTIKVLRNGEVLTVTIAPKLIHGEGRSWRVRERRPYCT